MATRFIQSAAARSLPLVAASWGVIQFQGSNSLNARCEKPTFQEAICIKNKRHTHNTHLITLKLPSDWNKERAAVANVVVRAEIEGTAVARPYNPLSAKSGDEVTLLVKRYGEDALMGSKLHNLIIGDTVEVKSPNKQWTLPDSGAVKRYCMIAGGTGITPIIQAAEGILLKDPDAKIDILTFNDTPSDILLKGQLIDTVLTYRGRLQVVNHVGSLPETMSERYKKSVQSTVAVEPSLEVLEKLLPKPTDHDGKVMVCVCGRPEMTAKVAGPKTKDYKQGEVGGVLKELGFTKEQVWKF